MSEAVEILIEAEDRASAKFKQVGNNVDSQVKRIKEVGGQAKASTELVGTLANSLGGTEFGSFAGGLAQLTERISAFAEVSKAGGAGALAFKAGVVAAAAVVTYNVADTIAGWWFEADRWRQAMEDGERAAQKAIAAMDRARSLRFADDREEFAVIRDPIERDAAINQRAAQLEKQAGEMSIQIAKDRAAVLKETDEELRATNQKNLESLEGFRDSLAEEAASLRDLTSERTKSLAARKEENAAKDRSRSFVRSLEDELYLLRANKEERLKLTAIMNAVDGDIEVAESLLREKESLLAKAEAEKKAEAEAEQARRKEQADAERVADIQQREVQRLEERRIAIEKGAEAAKAYALEQQGVDSAAAKSLAAQEAKLKEIEESAAKQKELATFQPGVQATQGRLLTRGPAERGIDKIAAAADKQVGLLDQIKGLLQNQPNNNSNGPKIVMVGP